jgi:hypothetical protein
LLRGNIPRERFLIERPERDLKIKKPPNPARRRMKAFRNPAGKQFQLAGLILLFAEKRPELSGQTSAIKPVS